MRARHVLRGARPPTPAARPFAKYCAAETRKAADAGDYPASPIRRRPPRASQAASAAPALHRS